MNIPEVKAALANYSERELDAVAAEIDKLRSTPKRWVVNLAGKLGFLAVPSGGWETQQEALDQEIARIDAQIDGLNRLRESILGLDVK